MSNRDQIRSANMCKRPDAVLQGAWTTKMHALSDPDCKPSAFHFTPSQDADIAAAPALLELAPPMSALIGDKGYDGDGFRADIVNRGAKPVIPNKSNRVTLHSFSKRAYKLAQCHRALLLPAQEFQACRNSLRQTGQKLLGYPRCHRRVLNQLSLGLELWLGIDVMPLTIAASFTQPRTGCSASTCRG